MIKTMDIQAVLFDYGMVLSGPPAPSAWARMLAVTGLDDAPFRAAYWEHRHAYDRGTFSGHEYWLAVGKRVSQSFDAAQVTPHRRRQRSLGRPQLTYGRLGAHARPHRP